MMGEEKPVFSTDVERILADVRSGWASRLSSTDLVTLVTEVDDLEKVNRFLRQSNAELSEKLESLNETMQSAEVFRISSRITVERTGDESWAVRDGRIVLSKTLGWIIERTPSNRDDDYLEDVRDTFEVAVARAKAEVEKDVERNR
jgi:hypothetical protein